VGGIHSKKAETFDFFCGEGGLRPVLFFVGSTLVELSCLITALTHFQNKTDGKKATRGTRKNEKTETAIEETAQKA